MLMESVRAFVDKKIKERDIEFFLFVLFFIFMAIYYGCRVCAHAPWYDELYTYYFFVSNGPIYSAIHWPVPNNHIGYSVLSGIVYEIIPNSFIALRGISMLASISNIALLFALCRRLFKRNYSIVAVCLYAGMWLVNNLSVQGRGYSLSTTMMLMSAYCMVRIIFDEEVKERFYVLWAVGLCYGLYVVTTSLYWVIPLCACAGICLLILKKYKELLHIILHSVYAAIVTAILYLTVWMAIGSNLLIKETTEYAGMGHVKLIANHPIKAAARGIEYMLATPYIQSVEKAGYRNAFGDHWIVLLSQMYEATSIVMIGLLMAIIFAGVFVVGFFILKKKNETAEALENDDMKRDMVLSVFVLCMVVLTPIVVMLQVKLPYYRVFSFYGASVSVALAFILYVLFGKVRSALTLSIPILVVTFVIAQLVSADYNESYGSREEAVYHLMVDNNLTEYSSVAVTDCDQEYMYRFVYDVRNENRDIENSEAVIIAKEMLDPEASEAWENYYNYSSLPIDNIKSRTLKYENDFYALYIQD